MFRVLCWTNFCDNLLYSKVRNRLAPGFASMSATCCVQAWCGGGGVRGPPPLPLGPSSHRMPSPRLQEKNVCLTSCNRRIIQLWKSYIFLIKWESLNNKNPNQPQSLPSLWPDPCWLDSMRRDGGVTSECSCERGCLHLAGRDSTDTRASRSSFEDNLRSSHARMVRSAYRLNYFLLSAILRSQAYFLLLTLVGTLLLFVVGRWEEGRGVRGQRLGRVLVIDRCVTRAGLPSCSLAPPYRWRTPCLSGFSREAQYTYKACMCVGMYLSVCLSTNSVRDWLMHCRDGQAPNPQAGNLGKS